MDIGLADLKTAGSEKMKETIEELRNNLKELEHKREIIINEIDKKESDIENSEDYKKLEIKNKELEKEDSKLETQERDVEKNINSDFTDDGNIPSYSTTYGKNIRFDVIRAIKMTFDFSKLNGGYIEDITSKMIEDAKDLHPELSKIKKRMKEICNEKNEIYQQRKDLKKSISREESDKISNQIHQIITNIAQLAVSKEKMDKKDFDGVNKWQKKEALEDYRSECNINYKLVLDNLNKIRNEK
jgi:DNA repair exonuclease SbcCD ATPase subunit